MPHSSFVISVSFLLWDLKLNRSSEALTWTFSNTLIPVTKMIHKNDINWKECYNKAGGNKYLTSNYGQLPWGLRQFLEYECLKPSIVLLGFAF